MSACEYCWGMSRMLGTDYLRQLKRAENDGYPCTRDTLEGRRLRAGQFWDEAKQVDRRTIGDAAEEHS